MDELLRAVSLVTEVLERLGVPYVVGGSLASSVHGHPRTTNDVDLVADLKADQVAPFADALENQFYLDRDAASDAIARGASFNLIHFDTAFKIDVFCPGRDAFRRAQIARRRSERVQSLSLPVLSPEDTILAKLQWFRLGGEVSEVQWRDVMGIIEARAEDLDLPYLREAAEQLGVADLLERALSGR